MSSPLFKKKGSTRWWCRVPNPEGGRHLRFPTGHRDRTAALAEWRQICRRQVSGSDRAEDCPPLADALGRREEEREQAGRAAATLEMYSKKGRHLTRIFGSETPIDQIDARAIDDYIAQRRSESAGPSTIHKELSILRGTLRLARRRKEYPHAVDEVMPLDFSPKYRPRERVLAAWEVDGIIGKLPSKRAAVVAFIVATGATYPSEATPIRPGDLAGTTIRLRGTKRESRDRLVPIPMHARRWLALAKKSAPFETWANIRRDLHAACGALKIEPCCPTDLRRTFGHMLRAIGHPPHLIGAALGHADSRMAERVYARLRPAELAKLLFGGQPGARSRKVAHKRRKTG